MADQPEPGKLEELEGAVEVVLCSTGGLTNWDATERAELGERIVTALASLLQNDQLREQAERLVEALEGIQTIASGERALTLHGESIELEDNADALAVIGAETDAALASARAAGLGGRDA